ASAASSTSRIIVKRCILRLAEIDFSQAAVMIAVGVIGEVTLAILTAPFRCPDAGIDAGNAAAGSRSADVPVGCIKYQGVIEPGVIVGCQTVRPGVFTAGIFWPVGILQAFAYFGVLITY